MTPHPGHQHPTHPHQNRQHPLIYTRADAIADGLMIEVPTRLSRQFGIRWQLAVSTLAWFDAIAWDPGSEAGKPRPTGQTESARIAEVLWAARQALTTHPFGARDIGFTVHRVPPVGPETRATRCTLRLSIHPGDHGETVATICQPAPVVAGRFVLPHHGDSGATFTAVAYDEDRDHLLWPVVTADTLDTILTEATRTGPGVYTTAGQGGVIHVRQPGAHPVSLRPDPLGWYHLHPLGWTCLLV